MKYSKYKFNSQIEVCEEYLLWVASKYPKYHHSEMISIVTNGMQIPRSSVRRVKSNLLSKLQFYVDILEEKKREIKE